MKLVFFLDENHNIMIQRLNKYGRIYIKTLIMHFIYRCIHEYGFNISTAQLRFKCSFLMQGHLQDLMNALRDDSNVYFDERNEVFINPSYKPIWNYEQDGYAPVIVNNNTKKISPNFYVPKIVNDDLEFKATKERGEGIPTPEMNHSKFVVNIDGKIFNPVYCGNNFALYPEQLKRRYYFTVVWISISFIQIEGNMLRCFIGSPILFNHRPNQVYARILVNNRELWGHRTLSGWLYLILNNKLSQDEITFVDSYDNATLDAYYQKLHRIMRPDEKPIMYMSKKIKAVSPQECNFAHIYIAPLLNNPKNVISIMLHKYLDGTNGVLELKNVVGLFPNLTRNVVFEATMSDSDFVVFFSNDVVYVVTQITWKELKYYEKEKLTIYNIAPNTKAYLQWPNYDLDIIEYDYYNRYNMIRLLHEQLIQERTFINKVQITSGVFLEVDLSEITNLTLKSKSGVIYTLGCQRDSTDKLLGVLYKRFYNSLYTYEQNNLVMRWTSQQYYVQTTHRKTWRITNDPYKKLREYFGKNYTNENNMLYDYFKRSFTRNELSTMDPSEIKDRADEYLDSEPSSLNATHYGQYDVNVVDRDSSYMLNHSTSSTIQQKSYAAVVSTTQHVYANVPMPIDTPPQLKGMVDEHTLTMEFLNTQNVKERKRLIGKELFPRIELHEPRLAAKLTGILLQMENKDLLRLLSDDILLLREIKLSIVHMKQKHDPRETSIKPPIFESTRPSDEEIMSKKYLQHKYKQRCYDTHDVTNYDQYYEIENWLQYVEEIKEWLHLEFDIEDESFIEILTNEGYDELEIIITELEKEALVKIGYLNEIQQDAIMDKVIKDRRHMQGLSNWLYHELNIEQPTFVFLLVRRDFFTKDIVLNNRKPVNEIAMNLLTDSERNKLLNYGIVNHESKNEDEYFDEYQPQIQPIQIMEHVSINSNTERPKDLKPPLGSNNEKQQKQEEEKITPREQIKPKQNQSSHSSQLHQTNINHKDSQEYDDMQSQNMKLIEILIYYFTDGLEQIKAKMRDDGYILIKNIIRLPSFVMPGITIKHIVNEVLQDKRQRFSLLDREYVRMNLQKDEEIKDDEFDKHLLDRLYHYLTEANLRFMMKDGSIRIDDILTLAPFSTSNITMDDLIELIDNDDAKRYKIDDVNMTIALNIEQKLNEFELLQEDQIIQYNYVCCGLMVREWPEVRKNGLRANFNGDIVFATQDVMTNKRPILGLNFESEIIVYIDLKKAYHDGFKFYTTDKNQLICKTKILPPIYLKEAKNFLRGFPQKSIWKAGMSKSKRHRRRKRHDAQIKAEKMTPDPQVVNKEVVKARIVAMAKIYRPQSVDHTVSILMANDETMLQRYLVDNEYIVIHIEVLNKKKRDFPKADYDIVPESALNNIKAESLNEVVQDESIQHGNDFKDEEKLQNKSKDKPQRKPTRRPLKPNPSKPVNSKLVPIVPQDKLDEEKKEIGDDGFAYELHEHYGMWTSQQLLIFFTAMGESAGLDLSFLSKYNITGFNLYLRVHNHTLVTYLLKCKVSHMVIKFILQCLSYFDIFESEHKHLHMKIMNNNQDEMHMTHIEKYGMIVNLKHITNTKLYHEKHEIILRRISHILKKHKLHMKLIGRHQHSLLNILFLHMGIADTFEEELENFKKFLCDNKHINVQGKTDRQIQRMIINSVGFLPALVKFYGITIGISQYIPDIDDLITFYEQSDIINGQKSVNLLYLDYQHHFNILSGEPPEEFVNRGAYTALLQFDSAYVKDMISTTSVKNFLNKRLPSQYKHIKRISDYIFKHHLVDYKHYIFSDEFIDFANVAVQEHHNERYHRRMQQAERQLQLENKHKTLFELSKERFRKYLHKYSRNQNILKYIVKTYGYEIIRIKGDQQMQAVINKVVRYMQDGDEIKENEVIDEKTIIVQIRAYLKAVLEKKYQLRGIYNYCIKHHFNDYQKFIATSEFFEIAEKFVVKRKRHNKKTKVNNKKRIEHNSVKQFKNRIKRYGKQMFKSKMLHPNLITTPIIQNSTKVELIRMCEDEEYMKKVLKEKFEAHHKFIAKEIEEKESLELPQQLGRNTFNELLYERLLMNLHKKVGKYNQFNVEFAQLTFECQKEIGRIITKLGFNYSYTLSHKGTVQSRVKLPYKMKRKRFVPIKKITNKQTTNRFLVKFDNEHGWFNHYYCNHRSYAGVNVFHDIDTGDMYMVENKLMEVTEIRPFNVGSTPIKWQGYYDSPLHRVMESKVNRVTVGYHMHNRYASTISQTFLNTIYVMIRDHSHLMTWLTRERKLIPHTTYCLILDKSQPYFLSRKYSDKVVEMPDLRLRKGTSLYDDTDFKEEEKEDHSQMLMNHYGDYPGLLAMLMSPDLTLTKNKINPSSIPVKLRMNLELGSVASISWRNIFHMTWCKLVGKRKTRHARLGGFCSPAAAILSAAFGGDEKRVYDVLRIHELQTFQDVIQYFRSLSKDTSQFGIAITDHMFKRAMIVCPGLPNSPIIGYNGLEAGVISMGYTETVSELPIGYASHRLGETGFKRFDIGDNILFKGSYLWQDRVDVLVRETLRKKKQLKLLINVNTGGGKTRTMLEIFRKYYPNQLCVICLPHKALCYDLVEKNNDVILCVGEKAKTGNLINVKAKNLPDKGIIAMTSAKALNMMTTHTLRPHILCADEIHFTGLEFGSTAIETLLASVINSKIDLVCLSATPGSLKYFENHKFKRIHVPSDCSACTYHWHGLPKTEERVILERMLASQSKCLIIINSVDIIKTLAAEYQCGKLSSYYAGKENGVYELRKFNKAETGVMIATLGIATGKHIDFIDTVIIFNKRLHFETLEQLMTILLQAAGRAQHGRKNAHADIYLVDFYRLPVHTLLPSVLHIGGDVNALQLANVDRYFEIMRNSISYYEQRLFVIYYGYFAYKIRSILRSMMISRNFANGQMNNASAVQLNLDDLRFIYNKQVVDYIAILLNGVLLNTVILDIILQVQNMFLLSSDFTIRKSKQFKKLHRLLPVPLKTCVPLHESKWAGVTNDAFKHPLFLPLKLTKTNTKEYSSVSVTDIQNQAHDKRIWDDIKIIQKEIKEPVYLSIAENNFYAPMYNSCSDKECEQLDQLFDTKKIYGDKFVKDTIQMIKRSSLAGYDQYSLYENGKIKSTLSVNKHEAVVSLHSFKRLPGILNIEGRNYNLSKVFNDAAVYVPYKVNNIFYGERPVCTCKQIFPFVKGFSGSCGWCSDCKKFHLLSLRLGPKELGFLKTKNKPLLTGIIYFVQTDNQYIQYVAHQHSLLPSQLKFEYTEYSDGHLNVIDTTTKQLAKLIKYNISSYAPQFDDEGTIKTETIISHMLKHRRTGLQVSPTTSTHTLLHKNGKIFTHLLLSATTIATLAVVIEEILREHDLYLLSIYFRRGSIGYYYKKVNIYNTATTDLLEWNDHVENIYYDRLNKSNDEVDYKKKYFELESKINDSYDYEWQWKNRHVWSNFSVNLSQRIENMSVGLEEVIIISPHKYTIKKLTIETGTQQNVLTNTVRLLRRTKHIKSEYPAYWDKKLINQQNYKKSFLVEIHPDSQRYQDIAKHFHNSTGSYSILKIEIVQNMYRHNSYNNILQQFINCYGKDKINQRRLYHGTQMIKEIVLQGFRSEYSDRVKYGKGVYFGSDVHYVTGFAKREGNSYIILVVNLLCGFSSLGNRSIDFRNWPLKKDQTPFETLIDDMDKPTKWVMKNNQQVILEAIIKFKDRPIEEKKEEKIALVRMTDDKVLSEVILLIYQIIASHSKFDVFRLDLLTPYGYVINSVKQMLKFLIARNILVCSNLGLYSLSGDLLLTHCSILALGSLEQSFDVIKYASNEFMNWDLIKVLNHFGYKICIRVTDNNKFMFTKFLYIVGHHLLVIDSATGTTYYLNYLVKRVVDFPIDQLRLYGISKNQLDIVCHHCDRAICSVSSKIFTGSLNLSSINIYLEYKLMNSFCITEYCRELKLLVVLKVQVSFEFFLRFF
eukprot:503230_1